METARPATADDLDDIVDLARQAIAELRGAKGGEVWFRRHARPEPLADAFAAAIADVDQLVVVGSIDGTTVGYGAVHLEPLAAEGPLAVVDDLFVLDGARGVGVGEAMMDQLLAWAQSAGAVGIDSLALPGLRETKNFFERFGLVARAILVHRAFDPPTEP
jgi:GNAT superfamily N-acetyltransferase